MPVWVDEEHRQVRYGLAGEVLVEKTSPFQRITLIRSERYGNALLHPPASPIRALFGPKIL